MLLPPLVAAVLAFLAGLLPALRFAPPPFVALVTAAMVVSIVLTNVHRASNPAASPAGRLLLPLAFIVAGAALGAARAAEPDCRTALPDRLEIGVVGILGAGVFPGEITDRPPLLPLAAARIGSDPGPVCTSPVRVILPEGTPEALAGSEVSFRGLWIRSRRNDDGSPWPIDGYRAGYFRAAGTVQVTPPDPLRHPLLTARGLSERHLQRLFPTHFALVEALLLGRRERVDEAVLDRFSRAGLTHLLAISGSHVAILAGVLLVLGGALRLPRRRITWGTIALVGLYLGLIGAPASALRSGAMVSLALLSLLLQRPSAMLPIAAAAFLVLVAIEPLAALDVGLQLSFAGVLGITAVQRTAGRRLARLGRGKPWKWLAETVLVSLAAFIATAPITAYQFGTIAPIAILANVPAIPLTGLALVGILAAAVVAPFRPLAELLAAGAGLALDLLDRVAIIAAAVPYGSAAVPRSQLLAWALAGGVFALVILTFREGRRLIRGVVATGTAVAALAVWPVVASAPSSGLEIHFLDVGQGDAVALRTPRGRWILVDAGPRSDSYDAGERRVVPFFRAHGVSRLEALILTHPDADHIGGAPAVFRHLDVERLIEPGLAVGKELYLEVTAGVEGDGSAWRAARGGSVLRIDGVEMAFLWPDQAGLDTLETNEASAVSIVRYGDFALLLPGDASSQVEALLVRRHGSALRSDILKAGHHGSSTSTSAEFLRTVDPDLVVISAGRDNRYGHPHAAVLARLTGAGVEIARTDLEGTISLRVRREGDGTVTTRIGG